MPVLTRFVRIVRRLRHSQSGNIAIVTGLLLPVIVGFCGLGIETGYWYFRERDIQAAADIAAYSGAVALRGGGSQDTVVSVATTQAKNNGWQSASGTINIHTPPTSGPNQNNNSVEVLLTENESRYFTAIFSSQKVATNVRAVATYVSAGPACMLALDKSKSGAMTFWGNAWADFTNCNVVSNSLADDSFKLGGSANVTTPCVSTAGGSVVNATLNLTMCAAVTTHSLPASDPYASVPAPPIPASCSTFPNSGTASPGKFCGGLTIQGTVNLSPGVYVISGGTLKVNASANITGSGVTFYLTNGATLSMNGNSNFNLSAPTTGDYKGLLFTAIETILMPIRR